MGKKISISVMIPAYNENDTLPIVFKDVEKILKELNFDYEILLFDDNSNDGTGLTSDNLAKSNIRVKVIHNKNNMGLGYNHRKAFELAKKEYFFWVPGDNEIKSDSIKNILRYVGNADMIITYTSNKEVRTFWRRFISGVYTGLINFLFHNRLKYYNGMVVHKTKLLRNAKTNTNSFAFQTEILIDLLRKGYSYIEVPMKIKKTKNTKCFRLKNLFGVISSIFKLFFRVYFKTS